MPDRELIDGSRRTRGEANLPAESRQEAPEARLSSAHEDPRGSGHPEAAAAEGTPAIDRERGNEVGPRMAQPTERLDRSERLRRSRDFQRVARRGTRVASRDFVLLVAPQQTGLGPGAPGRRLGVTASRKVGHAVTRNRVKRGIREWFRRHRSDLQEGVDVVVIARRGAADLPGIEINDDLRRLARRSKDGAVRSARRTGQRER